MSRLTPRDVAVFTLLAALTIAIAVFAVLDLTRWALVGVGLLVGASAVIMHTQFVARRAVYDLLRRESRASNRASSRILDLELKSQPRLNVIGADVRTSLTQIDAIAADLRSLARNSKADSKETRDKVSEMSIDSVAFRAELRGVRVAQQLFAQGLATLRNELGDVAAQISSPDVKADGSGAANERLKSFETGEDYVPTNLSGEVQVTDANHIVKQLQPAISAIEWQIRKQRADIVSDLQAVDQLMDRFRPDAPLPPVAGWALSPTALMLLTDTITRNRLELVVECGSGSSTLWMALAMRSLGRGKVIALEHQQEYADRTQAMLNAHGVAPWAEVHVAPLTTVATPQGEFKWYDTTNIVWEHPIDLLLVDGPPTTTGRHARYPALPTLHTRLRPGALIVVDDIDRQDERDVIGLWQAEFPELAKRASNSPETDVFSFGSAADRP